MSAVGVGVAEKADRFNERRALLAGSALRTLSELGYARTSLREIAQNSEFSHGVLHYYFRDKVDLILTSVRQYKSECVTRYDRVVARSTTVAQLRTGFAQAMARTLREEAGSHRLWYDLRSQSLFEPALQPDVLELDHDLERMIGRVVARVSELAGRPPAMTTAAAYAVFDGLFQQYLLHFLAGDERAPDRLAGEVRRALTLAVPAC